MVKPIARMTEISLTCSYRFPDIEEEREKKQMNMVIMMTILKMNSSVDSALMRSLLGKVCTYILSIV